MPLDKTPNCVRSTYIKPLRAATGSHCTANTEIGEISNPNYTTPSGKGRKLKPRHG